MKRVVTSDDSAVSCSRCRNYDCRDVDSEHLAACQRLRPCKTTDVSQRAANDDWNHPGLLVPSSVKKACVKARCTSKLGSTTAVDLVCASALCSRRLATTEGLEPLPVDALDQILDKSTSPQVVLEMAKRAGFTDTAGACMAFHCGGKSPGTLEFLLCASRNRCAG